MRRILFLLTATTALCAGPSLSFPLARYKGVEVTNGGSVKGVVTIDPVPAVAEFEIQKDAKFCGAKKPSFRLVVDPASKGVKNVVVYLDGIKAGKKRQKGQTFTINQKSCLYDPHILIVPMRSKVQFKSSDPILHNVHVHRGTPDQPNSKTEDILNVPFTDADVAPMEIGRRALRRPGFLAVQCDAGHIWMSAYIWVVEHPYYVLTDNKGKFELKDIPPGTYTLRFWHAGWKATPLRSGDSISGYEYGPPLRHSVTITIKAGEAAAAGWTISGS